MYYVSFGCLNSKTISTHTHTQQKVPFHRFIATFDAFYDSFLILYFEFFYLDIVAHVVDKIETKNISTFDRVKMVNCEYHFAYFAVLFHCAYSIGLDHFAVVVFVLLSMISIYYIYARVCQILFDLLLFLFLLLTLFLFFVNI